MTIFTVLYLLSSTIALAAGFPQIRQLLRIKHSDELSVSTWLTWAATQTISLLYVASLGETFLVITSSLWMVYYTVCIGLIFYYRKYPGGLTAESVEVTDSSR